MTLYAWYYSNKTSTIYTRTSTPSIEDTLYDSTGETIARSILSVASDYSYIKDDKWNEQHLRDSSKDIIEAQYVSNLSDGTNTYVIKDAEARTGLASKQDALISGTNIKTVGGTSLLGSGNIALPTKTSDLTNDSGFITGITSTDVTTALGYTPVKLDGGSSQQTIQLSSGTGTTSLGVKSRSTSSYISFTGTNGWLGSYGVSSDKKPVFYNGTGYTLAYTSDIPTTTSSVTSGSTAALTSGGAYTALQGYQTTANLVTSVSSSSTDSQYPSAKLFYDTVGDIESALNTINSGGGIQTVNLTVSLTGEPSYFQSITIDGVTYTSSSFTNNSMTVQIPKDTNVTWSATAVYSGYPLSGTLNESTDSTLSIHIYSGGGKD